MSEHQEKVTNSGSPIERKSKFLVGEEFSSLPPPHLSHSLLCLLAPLGKGPDNGMAHNKKMLGSSHRLKIPSSPTPAGQHSPSKAAENGVWEGHGEQSPTSDVHPHSTHTYRYLYTSQFSPQAIGPSLVVIF